jgi:hypothetical protein
MLLVDVAVGISAGLLATWTTDLAQGPLRRTTPDRIKRREEARTNESASRYA